jgi:hypothetical protein
MHGLGAEGGGWLTIRRRGDDVEDRLATVRDEWASTAWLEVPALLMAERNMAERMADAAAEPIGGWMGGQPPIGGRTETKRGTKGGRWVW